MANQPERFKPMKKPNTPPGSQRLQMHQFLTGWTTRFGETHKQLLFPLN
jgi:hypothetical protein